MLLTSVFVAGAAGVIGGLFFRVPAVIFATAVVVLLAAFPYLTGHVSRSELLMSVLLHVAVLQASYLATLLLTSCRSRERADRG